MNQILREMLHFCLMKLTNLVNLLKINISIKFFSTKINQIKAASGKNLCLFFCTFQLSNVTVFSQSSAISIYKNAFFGD